jgi:hypothetical protein
VVHGGNTFALSQAGLYILEIVDRFTSVSGSVEFRDSHAENFEGQSFELKLLNSQNPPPTNPGNPGGIERSSLGAPPTSPCVQIGSQQIGCR